jgi:hypothetical protein
VYDCFTFFNEVELLKVRFEELYDSVDYFVLVEATQTFCGGSKPLYFLDHIHDFAQYKDKIIHVVVDDFPMPTSDPAQDRWTREAFQRDAILRGLVHCNQDDLIFISDLDEIPNKQAIRQVKNYFRRLNHSAVTKISESRLICELHMKLFLFFLNCESPYGWKGAVKAAPYWLVKKKLPWNLKILHMHDRNLHKIYNAGWHFHNLFGSKQTLVDKLNSCYRYNPGRDFANGISQDWISTLSTVENWEHNSEGFMQWTLTTFGYQIVVLDDSYPQYILDHREYFRDLGWFIPLPPENHQRKSN